MTKVLVSIVNFNGDKDTFACLDSLEKVKIEDFELVGYDPYPPIKGEVTVVGGF